MSKLRHAASLVTPFTRVVIPEEIETEVVGPRSGAQIAGKALVLVILAWAQKTQLRGRWSPSAGGGPGFLRGKLGGAWTGQGGGGGPFPVGAGRPATWEKGLVRGRPNRVAPGVTNKHGRVDRGTEILRGGVMFGTDLTGTEDEGRSPSPTTLRYGSGWFGGGVPSRGSWITGP